MIQLNLLPAKQWAIKNWAFIALVIVCFLYLRSCEDVARLEASNSELKSDVKVLGKDAQRYVDIANAYRDTVIILKKKKPAIKDSIVYVEKKQEKDIKVVSSLTTKGIATYFQELYKIPVTITQYGVAVPDTLGKAVITDLIRGQGYKAQLKFTQELLVLEERGSAAKDSTITNQDKALDKVNAANTTQEAIIKNTEGQFKKERNKKTGWKAISGGLAILLLVSFFR